VGDNRQLDTPTMTMGEQFDELLPFYLSIGMTYTEYWDGDNKLPRYFRRAYKEKLKQRDYEMWRQGLYVYEAVLVNVNNVMAKKGSERMKYPAEPYMMREEKQKEEERKKLEMDKFKNWLEQLKQSWW